MAENEENYTWSDDPETYNEEVFISRYFAIKAALRETGPTPEGVHHTPKRPPMTKTPPTQKGFYWRQAGPGTEPVIVFVSRHLGFWVYELSGHDERIGIWDDEHVYWSAQPIMPDEMPEVQL